MLKKLIQYINERREKRWDEKAREMSATLLQARLVERFGPSQNELVLKFFKGEDDSRIPYSIDRVAEFTDDEMEMYHDFIQWVYPTIKPSHFHPDAPTIDADFVHMLEYNECAYHNYCRSCKRYLHYLNFECKGNGEILLQAGSKASVEEHAKDFYYLPGHNYLRITRALESLRDTGHTKCSQRLYAALMHSLRFAPAHWVSPMTLAFWKNTQTDMNNSVKSL